MKKVIKPSLLLLFILHTCVICGRGKEANVELTLQIDSYVSEVEQMVYAYRLEGNNYFIDDSVKIVPGIKKYTLRAYVPYETVDKPIIHKTWSFAHAGLSTSKRKTCAGNNRQRHKDRHII